MNMENASYILLLGFHNTHWYSRESVKFCNKETGFTHFLSLTGLGIALYSSPSQQYLIQILRNRVRNAGLNYFEGGGSCQIKRDGHSMKLCPCIDFLYNISWNKMIMYYGYIRCSHQGKLSEGTWKQCTVFATYCESKIIIFYLPFLKRQRKTQAPTAVRAREWNRHRVCN